MSWSDDEQSMMSYFEDLLLPQRQDTLQRLLDRGAAAATSRPQVAAAENAELAAIAESEGSPQADNDAACAPDMLAGGWQPLPTEERFQALFFEVGGMRFAIPLVDLGGIHPLGEVIRLPGKPDWFAGIVSHGDKRYHLVDSGRWFMPKGAGGEQYAYFVVLGGTAWGLGINRLLGTESLHRDDVRWRSAPGSQPWAAGTVKSRMCVLLYSGCLAQAIDQGLPV